MNFTIAWLHGNPTYNDSYILKGHIYKVKQTLNFLMTLLAEISDKSNENIITVL